MDTTPDDSQHNESSRIPDDAIPRNRFANLGRARIERISRRRAVGQPRWSLEMFESPLMDSGIIYTVHDSPQTEAGTAERGWIEFTRPTQTYRDPAGDRQVLVRLTVADGRLSITAPNCYPRGSLKRTTDPPPDRDGNLRLVRLGEDGLTQLDLIMASDGTITASLRMETLLRPFTRCDIVAMAEEFALSIDLLDFVVRQSQLLIRDPKSPDD